MFIDRDSRLPDPDGWVRYCLDRLEAAKSFSKGISWDSEIVHQLSVEEVVGALCSSEQHFKTDWLIDCAGSLIPEEFESWDHGEYRRGFIAALIAFEPVLRDKRSKRILREAQRVVKSQASNGSVKRFSEYVVSIVSQRLSQFGPKRRFLILRRDEYRCQICGKTAKDGISLEVDHKVPRSSGGTDDDDNLWTLCEECNRGKSAETLNGQAAAKN